MNIEIILNFFNWVNWNLVIAIASALTAGFSLYIATKSYKLSKNIEKGNQKDKEERTLMNITNLRIIIIPIKRDIKNVLYHINNEIENAPNLDYEIIKGMRTFTNDFSHTPIRGLLEKLIADYRELLAYNVDYNIKDNNLLLKMKNYSNSSLELISDIDNILNDMENEI